MSWTERLMLVIFIIGLLFSVYAVLRGTLIWIEVIT